MSSNHSTLQHPFSCDFAQPVPVQHPMLPVGYCLKNETDIQDALNNQAAVLSLLADLFGGDNEKYPILDSDDARHGMWLQLAGAAQLLKAITAALAQRPPTTNTRAALDSQ